MLIRFALSAILLTQTSISAATPLEPSGKWWLDYDEAQCIASRDYGSQGDPLGIGLKPSPKGGIMRILVIRNGPYIVADKYPASIQFDDRTAMRMHALQYSESQKKLRVMSINVPRSVIDANRNAKSLTISTAGFRKTFAMSDVPPLLAELDKCLVDLRDMWNIDKDERVAISAVPKEDLGKIFSPTDYPRSAIEGRDQGTVETVILVDEAGKIRDCSVETSSEIPTLDTMSCYVFQQRAEFSPAVGKSGQPIKSGFSQRISWRIAP
ncbi:MAG TPA: TonB family protein [Sphingomicrobium sp.]|nr:TonB family protein [Sphingomicrobium sp.]